MNNLNLDNDWKVSDTKVFWDEIAPCDHVVQIYENNEAFLDLLEDFVLNGIKADESVIVIATAEHLKELNKRLKAESLDLEYLNSQNQYIPLDADEALSKFMINGWPDRELFMAMVTDLLYRAKTNSRKVRAFGEMVAILWAKGYSGATVRLEYLWNKFAETEAFTLFCAYPQSGFTQNAIASVIHICGAHSKMIKENGNSKTEIFYKNTITGVVK